MANDSSAFLLSGLLMKLHGIDVPGADYDRLAQLEEIFFQLTPADVPGTVAHEWATRYALMVYAAGSQIAAALPSSCSKKNPRARRRRWS